MSKTQTVKSKRTWSREQKLEAAYLILMGAFLFAWVIIQSIQFSPDEQMRYKVVYYIFQHGKLPHGGDAEVMDASWGISYAFYPVLSYLPSVLFMKIASLFSSSSFVLLVAARLAEVGYGVGTAYLTMKIGKHFFRDGYEKMFLCLATLLPGAFVLFSYVNCDALALLATAMLIYSWIWGLEQNWSWKSCIFLAVGVSVCLLSYYNAYGVIVATVLVFVLSILFCEEKKWNFKKMFQRGLAITGIVVILAGWWFARNYVLYDGDALALNVTNVYAETYAEPERKPSAGMSFQENPTVNVVDMMLYQPAWHDHNWLMMVYYSFIGSFGYMSIWPPAWIGKAFMLFFLFGMLGVWLQRRQLFLLRKGTFRERKEICGTKVLVKFTYKKERWNKEAVWHAGLMVTLLFPNLLNVYNSYTADYQPQGRYSMPMLIPLMYFMTAGYRCLFAKLDPKGKAGKLFCYLVCGCMAAFLIYCYVWLVLPAATRKGWPPAA